MDYIIVLSMFLSVFLFFWLVGKVSFPMFVIGFAAIALVVLVVNYDRKKEHEMWLDEEVQDGGPTNREIRDCLRDPQQRKIIGCDY